MRGFRCNIDVYFIVRVLLLEYHVFACVVTCVITCAIAHEFTMLACIPYTGVFSPLPLLSSRRPLQMNDGLGGGNSDGIVFPTMGALFADLPAGSHTGMYLKRFRVQTQGHSPKGRSRLERSGQSTGQTWRPPQIITHLGLNTSGPWPPVENNQESFPCGGKGCPDVQVRDLTP